MSDETGALREIEAPINEAIDAFDQAEQRRREFLRGRMFAYRRVFAEGQGSADDLAIVMADLQDFCRATRTAFHADPRIHAMLEGRREVFLRIREHLDLTLDQLVESRTPGR